MTAQNLQRFIEYAQQEAKEVSINLATEAKKTFPIENIYTPRRIWSRKGTALMRNGIEVPENEDGKCAANNSTGICGLLKDLIEGHASSLDALKRKLSDANVVVAPMELEEATPIEIKALATALKIDMGNENYSQWLAKIQANPENYGFPESDNAAGESSEAPVAKAISAASKESTAPVLPGSSPPLSAEQKRVISRDALKDNVRDAKAAKDRADAAKAAKADAAKAAKDRDDAARLLLGGANQALKSFLDNANLQYFIMTFFHFLELNSAIYTKAPVPVQSAVSVGRGLQRIVFSASGGSITDTILNTPSHSIQTGGDMSDIRKIEGILGSTIKLYSSQLRHEVERLKNSMKQSNKTIDAGDIAQLDAAIDKVAKSEQQVLSTVLLGHKFLEAHREYSNADTEGANVSFQKLAQVAALVSSQSDKLEKRQQQVAQTIKLVLASFNPYTLYTRPSL